MLAKELQGAFEELLPEARAARRPGPASTACRSRRLASTSAATARSRAFERVRADQRRAGRKLYFAGDYLMDPSWNGALLSGQRAARAVQADLDGAAYGSSRAIVTPSPPSPGSPGLEALT